MTVSSKILEKSIPLCVPKIRAQEWNFIKDCLETNWVSSVGPYVTRFEETIADYIGTQRAVATVNGTAALHIALLVAGVEPNDEVLVSTLSFIAPANAIRYVNAWPVFIDAEPIHWQMDPQRVADFLQKECRWHAGALYNKQTRRRVKAILPVHILGHPVNINPILDLAAQFNLAVIEDAAEGLGAKYHGAPVGCAGHIACFSFNGNKIITAGSGGMIVTNNTEWAERAKFLTTQAKADSVEPIHDEIGFNYRLSNIHAALGCAQLEYLDENIRAKREIAAFYAQRLEHLSGFSPMAEASWAFSSSWMFTVLIDEDQLGFSRQVLLKELHESGIDARPLWRPIHLSRAHVVDTRVHAPVAEKIYGQALSLPCSVGLDADALSFVSDTIKTFCQKNSPRSVKTRGSTPCPVFL